MAAEDQERFGAELMSALGGLGRRRRGPAAAGGGAARGGGPGGGRLDPLPLELELVRVGGPAQRLVERNQLLLVQLIDRLIERLHAVLRGAGRDRLADQFG